MNGVFETNSASELVDCRAPLRYSPSGNRALMLIRGRWAPRIARPPSRRSVNRLIDRANFLLSNRQHLVVPGLEVRPRIKAWCLVTLPRILFTDVVSTIRSCHASASLMCNAPCIPHWPRNWEPRPGHKVTSTRSMLKYKTSWMQIANTYHAQVLWL